MVNMASFIKALPGIQVLQQTARVTMSLQLRGQDVQMRKYPISGFPRELMTEKASEGKLISPNL